MSHTIRTVAAMMAVMIPVIAQADDLTGANRFLCAATQVTRCFGRGDCESGPPWKWNMPSFIQVDLGKKTLSTPASSVEQRRSPITHLTRDDEGQIFLQGTENGRAFSMVIVEETGLLSMAVALDGITVSVFGACTPTP
jgi:hypothetical protein